ncbi:MAG: hypothetical protein NZ740_03645 [Kiritimatiellae bacterium]|nr:hypothetical protein [Kiritimatiellia bacterium]MDW8458182.1 hypothetical protein [Verrucomicrobiota bacterium]
MQSRYWFWIAAAMCAGRIAVAATVDVTGPRQVSLHLYDTGRALAFELRQVTAPAGTVLLRVRDLPARIDPTTVSVTPAAGGAGIDILEQRFEHDLAESSRMLRRYLNRTVTVGQGAAAVEGRIIGLPDWKEPPRPSVPLVLSKTDGSVAAFFSPAEAARIHFPDGGAALVAAPTLLWRARLAADGQQNFRLSYQFDGLTWRAFYDAVVRPDGGSARIMGRILIENRSGGHFSDAAVTLLETERGRSAGAPQSDEPAPQRYSYRIPQPREERMIATLSPVQSHALEQKVSLRDGEWVLLPLAASDSVPIRRFYVYDGVRFDRFQRNRRNDWNYGTEYHTTVDEHIEFENMGAVGLGVNFPQGLIRLYQQRSDGSVDLVGEEVMAPVLSGGRGSVRVGPAVGLRGERERTGYVEIRPLHEYEESFEIRLANESDQPAEIRVVEHLYRWPDYEIVKADAEYQQTGPQTIEFRAELKPGGRRAIHYTVRYRW